MISHESQKKAVPVYAEGVARVTKRILAGPRDGFAGFLREFDMQPGGFSPYHRHDWHHLVYVLEGEGAVQYEGQDHPLRKGSVVFIETGKMHGFRNTGESVFRFLCLVSEAGDRYGQTD